MHLHSTHSWGASIFFTLALLCPAPAGASTRKKVDVIHMKNGDRITCEIKKLEYGQLTVKAPYASDTFTLNWAEVEKVDSPQSFVVETQSGVYYTGTIRADVKQSDNLEVRTAAQPVSLTQKEIVNVGQYGRGLLDRIKFAIDYGFGYTRSNNQTQSTLHSDFSYRSAKIYTGATIDSLFSSQTDAPQTNRHQGSAWYYKRIQGSRWYGGGFGSMLTNNSQDLALRSNVGAGVLRNVLTTNKNTLLATVGMAYTNEKFTTPEPEGSRFKSAEAAVGFRYSTFRFDKLEFTVNYLVNPSLTKQGRVRTAADVNLYLKVIKDLYTRIGFYSNFDSHPPTNTAKNDYGFSTSVGWSF